MVGCKMSYLPLDESDLLIWIPLAKGEAVFPLIPPLTSNFLNSISFIVPLFCMWKMTVLVYSN